MCTERSRRIITLLLLAAVWTATAPAWAAPAIVHWQTGNGARVLFIAAPGIPMVDVRVTFDAGSARDEGRPGLSRLTSRLLDEGAGTWSAYEIAERFDDVGAVYESDTLRDMAWVALRSLIQPEWQDKAVDTFHAVLSRPAFDTEALERIRSNMLTSLQARQESPSDVGEDRWYAAMYGDHPYASPPDGLESYLKTATRAQVEAFFKRYYVGRNAVIAIVGDMDEAAARALSERLMDGVPAGERAPALPPVPKLMTGKDVVVPFSSTQTTVYSGQPTLSRTDPDYYVLYTGNYILGGGGLVSRLMDEIRDKRGLSYSVSSYFLPMAGHGPFEVMLQTRNDQADEATRVMRETLKRFIDEGPTGKELEAAIKGITGGFPLRIDTNAKLAEYIAMIGFYDLPLDYLETFPKYVSAVTVEDVRDAFHRRVDPERMVTVTVGGE